MERICIAALTFFNPISYHTVDSIIYFCSEIIHSQQKFYIMDLVFICFSESGEVKACFDSHLSANDYAIENNCKLSIFKLHH